MSFVTETKDGVIINVRVQPGAKKSRVIGPHGDAIKIAIAAPPVEGKANAALVEFIAELFSVKRSQVELVRGETSRSKTLLIRGINAAQAARIL
ncbi:MAG: DUF167 domain-containing protein [Gemmataceae bacterium]